MGLKLTVLGCSGSYPGPEAACSGYLVQGGGVNVVLDLGPGTLANLQRHLPLGDIDAVVLSHRHPDHWIDLTGLETAWKYALRREGLLVYGTAENRAQATGLIGDLEPVVDWREIADGSTARIGGLELGFSATDHYVETLATRVAGEGAALGYSADTGPGWSFSELGASIELGLCEATTLADGEGDGVLHLSARQAGSMATAAGVGRLVLTHFQPGRGAPADFRREAATTWTGPLELACEHATYEV